MHNVYKIGTMQEDKRNGGDTMNCQNIKLSSTASLDTYFLHNSEEYNVEKKRPVVLVLPGGGYAFTSDREAEPIALKFNSIGLHAAILWYTVCDQVKDVPEHSFQEAMKAVLWIRRHAKEYLIDPDRVIVCEFSAGGHLCVQCAVRWQEEEIAKSLGCTSGDLKINLAIAGYPVVRLPKAPKGDLGFGAECCPHPNTTNERYFGTDDPDDADVEDKNLLNKVGIHTPPMFIWHTYEDQLVPVMDAVELAAKMKEHNRPFELHIFEKGEHGLALGDRTTARKWSHMNFHIGHWFELCEEWMRDYIDVPEDMFGKYPKGRNAK